MQDTNKIISSLNWNFEHLEPEDKKKEMKEHRLKVKNTYNQILSEYYETTGIPLKFNNVTMSKCNRDIVSIVRDNRFTILKGKLGCGKTSLAVSYMKWTIKRFVNKYSDVDRSHYFRFDLKAKYLRCYILETFDINEIRKYLDPFIFCDILIVDDLGFVKNNDFIKRLVGAMLLERIDNRKKTIITLNESIKNIFDERVCDKIMEEFKLVEFSDTNRRVKKEPETF